MLSLIQFRILREKKRKKMYKAKNFLKSVVDITKVKIYILAGIRTHFLWPV